MECGAGKERVLTVASVLLLSAGELNVNSVPLVIVPLLVTVSAVLASCAGGRIRNLGTVSYSDTRTSNAGFTRAAEEYLRDGDNLVGKEGYVKGLRNGSLAVEDIRN